MVYDFSSDKNPDVMHWELMTENCFAIEKLDNIVEGNIEPIYDDYIKDLEFFTKKQLSFDKYNISNDEENNFGENLTNNIIDTNSIEYVHISPEKQNKTPESQFDIVDNNIVEENITDSDKQKSETTTSIILNNDRDIGKFDKVEKVNNIITDNNENENVNKYLDENYFKNTIANNEIIKEDDIVILEDNKQDMKRTHDDGFYFVNHTNNNFNNNFNNNYEIVNDYELDSNVEDVERSKQRQNENNIRIEQIRKKLKNEIEMKNKNRETADNYRRELEM
jgi:hypothetical protein